MERFIRPEFKALLLFTEFIAEESDGKIRLLKHPLSFIALVVFLTLINNS